MFDNIKADILRYKEYGRWYLHSGFWVVFTYRFGSWILKIKPVILRFPFRLLYYFMCLPVHILLHVYIPSNAIIGPGLLLEHPNLIYLARDTVVGSSCTIFHDVTFGRGVKDGAPALDSSVVVFPGARLLGGIKIGEHAHIGANAVVTTDIKPWSMVIAPPSRQLPMEMTKALLKKNENSG